MLAYVILSALSSVPLSFTPDGGGLPMVFTFEPNKNYELIGKVTEPKPHVEFDSTFGVNILTFEGTAVFTQKVKIKGSGFSIKGDVSGQVCKTACTMFDSLLGGM